MKYMKKIKFCMFLICCMAMIGLVIYIFVIPRVGQGLVEYLPEYEHAYLPWLIFLWCTGIPCYGVLYEVWKVCENLYLSRFFEKENAQRMHRVSLMAKIDTIFLLIGNLVLLLFNINHVSIIILFVLVAFVGVFISTVAEIMSKYIIDASSLKEEAELTI